MEPRRPSLLVVNQYYAPGLESTAQLLTQLCEGLVPHFDVTVVTGTVAGERLPRVEDRNGVSIVRVNSTAFDRRRLILRGANYVSFLIFSFMAGLRATRPDLVLCMSDPPFISIVGAALARRFSAPLVVVTQDVFPEVAVRLGRIDDPVFVRTLDLLVRSGLSRADRVVAIGETMRERLREKGIAPARIVVIPNWTDTAEIVPRERDNSWAEEQGLSGRFVVMHSGNVGYAQDLVSFVRAGTYLRDLADLALLVIGSGAMHAELVRLAKDLDVDAVRFLPYQPRDRLSDSLSSADVHVVGLARGLAGYVVPSRIYGVLAAGRPVIVAADEASETAQLVREVGCGVVVPPGRPDVLAEAIRGARAGQLPLAEMGARAREYAVREARRDVAVDRYRELIHSQIAGKRALP